MKKLSALFCLCLFALSTSVFAQSREGPTLVQVTDVDFNSKVRPFDWSNMVIELEAQQNEDPDARNPRYVENIKVTVTLGYEIEGGTIDYYQSSAEIIALEVSQKRSIAFWLPEVIVERDNLNEEPTYWLIELEAAGRPVPLDERRHFNRSKLRDYNMIQGFKARAAEATAATAGYLLPTYLTPYPETAVEKESVPFKRKEMP
jgi:hypothetical protein